MTPMSKKAIESLRILLEKHKLNCDKVYMTKTTEEEFMDYRDKMVKQAREQYEAMDNETLIDQAINDVWSGDPKVDCLLTEIAKRYERLLNEVAS